MLKLQEYIIAALKHAAMSIHHPACKFPVQQKNCSCHVGKAQFALSLYTAAGHLHAPTCEELNAELGANWVLARRTPRVVSKYGESVKCYSPTAYAAAERAALAKRAVRMGVVPFTLT